MHITRTTAWITAGALGMASVGGVALSQGAFSAPAQPPQGSTVSKEGMYVDMILPTPQDVIEVDPKDTSATPDDAAAPDKTSTPKETSTPKKTTAPKQTTAPQQTTAPAPAPVNHGDSAASAASGASAPSAASAD